MNADDLQRVQTIFRHSSQVIWIHSADYMGQVKPQFGLVSGLSRALAFEQPKLQLCTFDIGQAGLRHMTSANLAHIVKQMSAGQHEREYSQNQVGLHVPRFLPVLEMNAQFQNKDHGRTRISLEDAQRCHLTIKSAGLFQTLAFQASTNVPILDPNFVEVQVKAASINAKVKYLSALDSGLYFTGLLRTTRTSEHTQCYLLTRLQRHHYPCWCRSTGLRMRSPHRRHGA